MTDLSIKPDHLLELVSAVCSKDASGNDFVALNSILLADEVSRRRYLSYCRMHASLRLDLRSHAAAQKACRQMDFESGASVPRDFTAAMNAPSIVPFGFLSNALHGTIGFFSQELPFSLLVAAVLTSLGLWFASMIYVSSPDKIAKDSLPPVRPSVDPTLKVVGKITGMVNCKWADPNTETSHGANVLLGRKYSLASGLIEISYDTGAKVILQGPVTYEVDSRDSGFLSRGKLTAKLEKKPSAVSRQSSEKVASETNPKSQNPEIPNPLLPPAPMFAVRTPSATVTDLGTEFGVNVIDADTVHVDVFVGAVNVTDAHTARLARAGEAVHINRGVMKHLKLDQRSNPFIRAINPPRCPSVLLRDNFNGNIIDWTKWKSRWLFNSSRVLAGDGRLELTCRGYLITKKQYDPDAIGGITITGQWTPTLGGDALCINTRSSDTFTTSSGLITSGLMVLAGNNTVTFRAYSNGVNVSSTHLGAMTSTGKLTITAGETYNFILIDNGVSGLAATFTQEGDPSNTQTVKSTLLRNPDASANYISFCNREWDAPPQVSFLDNITISSNAPQSPPADRLQTGGMKSRATSDSQVRKGGAPTN